MRKSRRESSTGTAVWREPSLTLLASKMEEGARCPGPWEAPAAGRVRERFPTLSLQKGTQLCWQPDFRPVRTIPDSCPPELKFLAICYRSLRTLIHSPFHVFSFIVNKSQITSESENWKRKKQIIFVFSTQMSLTLNEISKENHFLLNYTDEWSEQ